MISCALLLKKSVVGLVILFTVYSSLFSQQLTAIVADQDTKQPISDVFVFLGSSSIGTITDDSGVFQLNIKNVEQATLVFSHLNYELMTLMMSKERLKEDTFFLVSSGVALEAVEVTVKAKPRIRAKRLKKFKDAFIGVSRESKNIKLLNPEVLVFEEQDRKLIATATQPLQIENKLLGYQLDFYLKTFELDLINQDVFYKGSPFFKSLKGSKKELTRYSRNRKKAYQKTSRKFFSELVMNALDIEKYDLGYAALDRNRKVVHYQPITIDSLQIEAVGENKYTLPIKGYLAITDASEKLVQEEPSTKLSANFSTGIKAVKKTELLTATSYLKSESNHILFNEYGIILNPLEVEEYGFWSEQRIAFLLPLDYQE